MALKFFQEITILLLKLDHFEKVHCNWCSPRFINLPTLVNVHTMPCIDILNDVLGFLSCPPLQLLHGTEHLPQLTLTWFKRYLNYILKIQCKYC